MPSPGSSAVDTDSSDRPTPSQRHARAAPSRSAKACVASVTDTPMRCWSSGWTTASVRCISRRMRTCARSSPDSAMTPHRPPAPSTVRGAVSSWPRAPPRFCSRLPTSPANAAHALSRRSPGSVRPATPTAPRHRIRPPRERPGRSTPVSPMPARPHPQSIMSTPTARARCSATRPSSSHSSRRWERGHRRFRSRRRSPPPGICSAQQASSRQRSLRCLRDQVLPPTINLTDPDAEGWDFVRDQERRHPVRTVLSTSFGFGGHNAALLLRLPR